MDFLSLLGVILAFAAIIGGNFLEGGHLTTLMNGPAALVVLGGTLGAAAIQTPRPIFFRALTMFKDVFIAHRYDLKEQEKKIQTWSKIARRDGLIALDKIVASEKNSFLKKALSLLSDGSEPEHIRTTLELELAGRERQVRDAANVYDAMGGYAPTIGIIGAVLGLIHVMGNLADPSQLGTGIAVAFVATIYGVGLANLLLLPVANKIRANMLHETIVREMVIEGVMCIAEGQHPRTIAERLKGFYAQV